MTKRGASSKKRLTGPERNEVATPIEAVIPLLGVLQPGTRFSEPCAGDGQLKDVLEVYGHVCVEAFDVKPRGRDVLRGDATEQVPTELAISNPPYERKLATPILDAACTWPHPSWWLVPLDWIANRWFAPYAPHVARILPVGRVSWIRDAQGNPTGSGFENSIWLQLRWMPTALVEPRRDRGEILRRLNMAEREAAE